VNELCQDKKSELPGSKEALDEIASVAASIEASHEPYREMCSRAYCEAGFERIMELTRRADVENFPAYDFLGRRMFDVGANQIDVLVRPNYRRVRKIHELAGRLCADDPRAVETAGQIRAWAREVAGKTADAR
jgi:hypothetical protein